MLTQRASLRPVSAAPARRLSVVVRAAAKSEGDAKPKALGKTGLVDAIASKTGVPKKDAEAVFDELIATITTTVAKGERWV